MFHRTGTTALREAVTVSLLRFPGGEVLSETTVYGELPPDKIEYEGKAPVYRTGGKPSSEAVSAAVLECCGMVDAAA